MNILMMTNTYKPILGGLERSIEAFTKVYRKQGHRVLIVVPQFENSMPEKDVIRIPAIQNFNGTDFSVQLPVPGVLNDVLAEFKPDIVHTHHPFLVGDTAIRIAYKLNLPIVFTHHTLYEQNTHYVPGDSEALKRFVIQLSSGYANLVDQVFAPSESVMELMRERGVTTPIDVVPTGIALQRFSKANRDKIRSETGIPPDAFVVGHLGRLAPEKNLEFLASAVMVFLSREPEAHFLVVGKGPSEEQLRSLFQEPALADRLHLTGPLAGQDLVDAYHAMDVFAFASQSETQGLVLTEALASEVPVVAVDAPGVREVVQDQANGRLVPREDLEDFIFALQWMMRQKKEKIEQMKEECLAVAESFSMDKCARRALEIYTSLIQKKEFDRKDAEDNAWRQAMRLIRAHWELAKNLTKATTEALTKDDRPS